MLMLPPSSFLPRHLTPLTYSIINNMFRLVNSPITVHSFLPKLLLGLIKAETLIGDPKACSIVRSPIATLHQIGKVPTNGALSLPPSATANSLSPTVPRFYSTLALHLKHEHC